MNTSPDNCKPPGSFFVGIPPGWMYRLSIPESFRQYLDNTTGKNSTVILRRGNQKWQVKLANWVFGEGWEDFVTDNGVEDRGNIMICKYDGGMVFYTNVFDMSLCELQYPKNKATKVKKILKKDTSAIRNSSSSKLAIGKKSFRCRSETETETETETDTDTDTDTETETKVDTDTETETEIEIQTYTEVETEMDLVGPSTTTLGLSVNRHPHFIATLKSDSKYVLYLPSNFIKATGLRKGMITLMNDQHEEWMVKLVSYKNSHRLGEGWKIFYRANGLKKGVYFKLELVKTGDEPVAMFHPFSKSPPKQFFRSIVTADCINASRVNIPNGFARANRLMNRHCDMVMIDEEQKQWPMKLTHPDRVRIIRSRNMLLANGVKEGDDFLIELVDNGNIPVMRFHRC